jgi:hypothetical protein
MNPNSTPGEPRPGGQLLPTGLCPAAGSAIVP